MLKNYTIDYNNGFYVEIEADNLDEVIEEAEDRMGYTQEDVKILDENGEEVARSYWVGAAPDSEDEDFDEDDVLMQFGDFGYYTRWRY